MTIFAEANVDVDLRMLRSFRVLRPLKLVSRIPSKERQQFRALLFSTICYLIHTLTGVAVRSDMATQAI